MDNKPEERILHLHFGEIATIEANLQNMEEQVVDEGVFRPMDRGFVSIRTMLLKLGSSFLESFDSRNEFDRVVPIPFTEGELWTLRRIVNIGATFKGVPIGEILKKKIFEAIIDIENKRFVGEDFSLEKFMDNSEIPTRDTI